MTAMPVPSEDREQITVVEWLRWHRVRAFHVPNEGRHKVQYRKKQAALGVEPGVPDLVIIDPPPLVVGCVGAVIEMKRRRGGVVRKTQRQWLKWFEERRWVAAVCRGSDEAIGQLESWGYHKYRRKHT
jgi:hypothetical protein